MSRVPAPDVTGGCRDFNLTEAQCAALAWFDDSPDRGPDCLCSHCGEPIGASDFPLRLWVGAVEARLHVHCLRQIHEGVVPPETQP